MPSSTSTAEQLLSPRPMRRCEFHSARRCLRPPSIALHLRMRLLAMDLLLDILVLRMALRLHCDHDRLYWWSFLSLSINYRYTASSWSHRHEISSDMKMLWFSCVGIILNCVLQISVAIPPCISVQRQNQMALQTFISCSCYSPCNTLWS